MLFRSPLFEALFDGPLTQAVPRLDRGAALDAYVRDGDLWLQVDLPGVREEDISVEVDRHAVRIRAERRMGPDPTDRVLRNERAYGTFEREIRVAQALDADNAHASYDAGVLTVRVPLHDKTGARKLTIGSGAPAGAEAQAIESGDKPSS